MKNINKGSHNTPSTLSQPHQAGDRIDSIGGRISYLAPLPLPTGQPANDYAHAVGEVNDTYLTFGVGLPAAFGWQLMLGGTFFTAVFMPLILFPLIIAIFTIMAGGTFTDVKGMSRGTFLAAAELVPFGIISLLGICLFAWSNDHHKYKQVIASRFNRQRRELYIVPQGKTGPIFVPWESISAWVIEAQGVTQYGVQRQYAMGMGIYDAESDKEYSLEFVCGGLPLAIANWEAIRAYMEYEVHTLKEIQDPLDLQGPDDPPHEGLHTFHNARARMRRRYREGEVGKWYVLSWYLYHLMTLWTLPFHLTEREIRSAKQKMKGKVPAAVQAWSQPLPPEQWAKPSAELQRQTKKLAQLRQRHPQRDIFELFTEAKQK